MPGSGSYVRRPNVLRPHVRIRRVHDATRELFCGAWQIADWHFCEEHSTHWPRTAVMCTKFAGGTQVELLSSDVVTNSTPSNLAAEM